MPIVGYSRAPSFSDPSAIGWAASFWAEDPKMVAPAADGAVEWWRNGGTTRLEAGSTYLDATEGLHVPFNASFNTFAAYIDDAAVLDIAGDLEFECLLKLDDYTPGTVARGIVERRVSNAETTTLAWEFAIRTDGTLQTIWHENDGTQRLVVSTASVGITDGTEASLKTTIDVDNGGQWQVKFFKGAAIGATTTQIGAAVDGSTGPTTIRDVSSPLSFGTAGVSGDAKGIGGFMRRAVLRSGIGGTVVVDADFRRADTGWFTEDSVNALTVKVRSNHDFNQKTSTKRPLYRAAGINSKPTLQGDGSNDYLGVVDAASLFDTPIAQPYSVVLVMSGSTTGRTPGHVRSATRGWVFYHGTSSAWWSFAGSALIAPNNSADSGAHLARFLANNTASVMAEDETVLVTGAGGTETADAMGMFDANTSVYFPFAGHIAFMGLYSGDVTADAKWSQFKTWVTSYYGITVA